MASPELKNAAFEAGKMSANVKDAAIKFAEDQKLSDKVQELKQKGMDKWTAETGRNASVDGSILKYSAFATVGAMAISAAPALIIGAAAATAAVGIASTQVDRAVTAYSITTGRDGQGDKQKIMEAALKAKEATIDASSAFKQGFDSVDKASSPSQSSPTKRIQ